MILHVEIIAHIKVWSLIKSKVVRYILALFSLKYRITCFCRICLPRTKKAFNCPTEKSSTDG